MSGPEPLSYAQAGRLARSRRRRRRAAAQRAVASTRTPRVLGDLGGFAGLVSAGGYRDPVLVAGTDGVGTKLLLQREAGTPARLRRRLRRDVRQRRAHAPAPSRVLFLDYIAVGRLDPERVADAGRGRRRRLPPGRLRAARRRDGRAARHVRRATTSTSPASRSASSSATARRRPRGSSAGDAVDRPGRERRALQRLHARAPPARARRARARRRARRPARARRASTRARRRRCAAPATCAPWRTSPAAASPGNLPRVLPAGLGARVDERRWPAPAGVRVAGRAGRRARRDAPRLQRRRRLRGDRPARGDVATALEACEAPAARRGRSARSSRARASTYLRATSADRAARRAGLGLGLEPAGAASSACTGARRRSRASCSSNPERLRARARRGAPASSARSSRSPAHDGERERRERRWPTWLDARGVELVVCAGFMGVLTAPFLDALPDRVLNLHPVAAARLSGRARHRGRLRCTASRETGVTVHLVDEVLDGGPIVAAGRLPVNYDEDPEGLRARIHAVGAPAPAGRRRGRRPRRPRSRRHRQEGTHVTDQASAHLGLGQDRPAGASPTAWSSSASS